MMLRSSLALVLALLAVLSLLTTPVAASAAQAICAQGMPTAAGADQMTPMPGMDMPMSTPDQAHAPAAGDHCCGQSDQHPAKGKSCALACAATCAVQAALPAPLAGPVPGFLPASVNFSPDAFVRAYRPAGPERPPKSIV